MGTMQRRERGRSRREGKESQNDIKKLRRENEQLRREIWSLRDEYDKLEEILKKQKSRGESEEYEDRSEEDDNEVPSDFSCEEDEEANGGPTEDLNKEEQLENAENQKISSEKMTSNSLHRLHVDFDDLSVVDEEEEIKKDKEKKDANLTEESQQQQREETKNTVLLPRQLRENIPFYPATYESPNTFSSSSYYTECPFQFPSTIDLMLPTDTPGLLASPCSRLHADPLHPLMGLDASSLEQAANRMLPQIRVATAGWQANLVLPQEQLPSYSTVNTTTAAVPSAGIQLFDASAAHVHQNAKPKQQQFGSGMETASFTVASTLMPKRNDVPKQSINFFDSKPFDNLRAQRSAAEKPISENGWMFDASSVNAHENETGDQNLQNDLETEDKNLEGIFNFGRSDRPKHFFSPLPSKLKKSTEGGSPTTSHFGTGNSSSSGKTGSTVISKSQYAIQKGSADIYVNGAIACEDNLQRDGQKTFLSTDNLLIIDGKSSTANQLTKSMSCQDLISESHSDAVSQHLKINQGEAKQQILTQSDNTLDSLTSHKDSKPFKSHLNVTLKIPKTGQLTGSDTPEIPQLPSIDYRLLKNPFLRNFEQTSRNYTDQNSPVTRPLSVQVNDDNFCYHYPNPPNVSAFNRGFHSEDRYRTLHGKSDQNRLLIPSNQLINGQILSPLNKHEIQVTSFERPSPHTLIPPATPYDLNTLRKINTNPYLQNRSLYQNIPFVPRGPAQLYPQGVPMRMYYDNVAIKVPAQTQTSIDGDSHQEDDQMLSQQDEGSVGAPGSPSDKKRRKAMKKEKTFSPGKDQKPLSPVAQRRLRKQSSVTSTETVDSPTKLTRKRPRKLSVTTTTTSEAQEDKNESRSSSSGQDSPRKDQTRRVSLYFNAKKRPSLTSVKTARSGSLDITKDKYIDGVLNSERERTNSISSRETTNVKTRKTSTSSGKVPWCACWGNGCI